MASALHLRPGGRLGFVLPAELLTANYAGAVRRFLFEKFNSIELVLFEERVFAEAETEVARIRTEAEAKQREETARLDRERNTLEGRITELREFERDYRSKLRNLIEGQLRDLDQKAGVSDSTPVSAIGL